MNITITKARKLGQALNMWWREVPSHCLDHEEFSNLYQSLDKSKLARTKTQCKDWDVGSWFIETSTNNKKCKSVYGSIQLYYWDPKKGPVIYYTNPLDNNRNLTAKGLNENPGTLAYRSVVQKFAEDNDGATLRKAFGNTEAEYKFCVPKQFYWIDPRFLNVILPHASAIDYCSQYPSNLCGTMPDASTKIVYKGRVKPTEEYPFAFYLKTGTVAEYGKYDTHDWIESKFSDSLFTFEQLYALTHTADEDEITVLMKPSKYTFDSVMKHFYAKRKTDVIAKLVMNAFIGMLHTRSYTSHKYTHLAAISIARSNERMRKMAEDNILTPVHICVDGCIYIGSTEYGVKEKALTLCNQEFTDCRVKITQMNCYVVMQDDKVIKFKHGAFNKRIDNIDIEQCEGFDYLDKLVRVDVISEILKEVEELKNGKQSNNNN